MALVTCDEALEPPHLHRVSLPLMISPHLLQKPAIERNTGELQRSGEVEPARVVRASNRVDTANA